MVVSFQTIFYVVSEISRKLYPVWRHTGKFLECFFALCPEILPHGGKFKTAVLVCVRAAIAMLDFFTEQIPVRYRPVSFKH